MGLPEAFDRIEREVGKVFCALCQLESAMTEMPPCPECGSTFTYHDGTLFVCPECGHEWSGEAETSTDADEPAARDANGNPLADGDTVTVIKDLKLKGGSGTVKVGTKVKNIRIVEGDHDIDCKVEGFGPMKLKSEFVKKA